MPTETKIKSHPKVTYLDTNNFYGLAINAVYGSNLESVKSNDRFYTKKYQSDSLTNNQQKGVDCLKPRSNKNELECKKCGCDYFYVLIIKVFHL